MLATCIRCGNVEEQKRSRRRPEHDESRSGIDRLRLRGWTSVIVFGQELWTCPRCNADQETRLRSGRRPGAH